MPPADETRPRHMLEAIEAAEQFAAGRERRDLDDDRMLLFALVRAVEILGEAASRVTVETRQRTPLPWAEIVGMRNRLVHAYFDINRDILWLTLRESLPALKTAIRTALQPATP